MTRISIDYSETTAGAPQPEGPSPAEPAYQPVTAPQIGRWQTIRLLGEGRWSRVYQARPKDCPAHWPADYALKISRREDSLATVLIQREALVGREVTHPHLASVLSCHVDHPPFYLVLPFYNALPVETVIQQQDQLPIPTVLWVVRQAAEALQALHAAGWRHGDVKPANILISADGHVTLIDLAFAQRIDGSVGADEHLGGTPAYTAPEGYSAGTPAGASSDLYSLGVTLYQLLTGRLPFEENDPEQLADAHLHAAPPDPRRLRPQLCSGVSRLLKDLLAKQPLRRPCTEEVVQRLVELEIALFDERVAA